MTNNKLKPTIRPNTNDILDPTITTAITPDNYINYPFSSSITALRNLISSGSKYKELKERNNEINPNLDYALKTNGDLLNYKQVNPKNGSFTELTVSLSGITNKSNKTTRKIVDYIFVKLNEQCIRNKETIYYTVSFPLAELQKSGAYGSLYAARRAFYSAREQFLSYRIYYKSVLKRNSKTVYSGSTDDALNMFRRAKIENNQCIIYLDKDINYAGLLEYYALMPAYQFSLTNNAYILSAYIAERGRQNYKEILDSGQISIPLKTVSNKLFLPSTKETENPTRVILTPIINAVNEINNREKENSTGRTLILDYDKNENVSNIISNGRLIVKFNDVYAMQYEQIADKRAFLIERQSKKKNKEG